MVLLISLHRFAAPRCGLYSDVHLVKDTRDKTVSSEHFNVESRGFRWPDIL